MKTFDDFFDFMLGCLLIGCVVLMLCVGVVVVFEVWDYTEDRWYRVERIIEKDPPEIFTVPKFYGCDSTSATVKF